MSYSRTTESPELLSTFGATITALTLSVVHADIWRNRNCDFLNFLLMWSPTLCPQGARLETHLKGLSDKGGCGGEFTKAILTGACKRGAKEATLENTAAKGRYDWSYTKLWVKDELTGYLGFSEFHIRVDEFSTLRIPLADASILSNPHVTVWLEFPGTKNITTSYSLFENVTSICPGGDTTCEEGLNVTREAWVTHEVVRSVPIVLPPKRVAEIKEEIEDILVVINAFTIIVKIEKGVIVDAVWDGDRDTNICKKSCDYCVDNQCAIKHADLKCEAIAPTYDDNGVTIDLTAGKSGCAFKAFVAWQGTDKTKSPCISIAKIPSAFSKYSSNTRCPGYGTLMPLVVVAQCNDATIITFIVGSPFDPTYFGSCPWIFNFYPVEGAGLNRINDRTLVENSATKRIEIPLPLNSKSTYTTATSDVIVIHKLNPGRSSKTLSVPLKQVFWADLVKGNSTAVSHEPLPVN
eukprot:gene10585-12316_t